MPPLELTRGPELAAWPETARPPGPLSGRGEIVREILRCCCSCRRRLPPTALSGRGVRRGGSCWETLRREARRRDSLRLRAILTIWAESISRVWLDTTGEADPADDGGEGNVMVAGTAVLDDAGNTAAPDEPDVLRVRPASGAGSADDPRPLFSGVTDAASNAPPPRLLPSLRCRSRSLPCVSRLLPERTVGWANLPWLASWPGRAPLSAPFSRKAPLDRLCRWELRRLARAVRADSGSRCIWGVGLADESREPAWEDEAAAGSRSERLLSDSGPAASTCVVPEAIELPPVELMLCLALSTEAEPPLPAPKACRAPGSNELAASWDSAMGDSRSGAGVV